MWKEAFEALAKIYSEGKLKIRETVLTFAEVPEGFAGLFTGRNTGKMIIDATTKL
jgi:NADPH-dependent curcumin reductase CurA